MNVVAHRFEQLRRVAQVGEIPGQCNQPIQVVIELYGTLLTRLAGVTDQLSQHCLSPAYNQQSQTSFQRVYKHGWPCGNGVGYWNGSAGLSVAALLWCRGTRCVRVFICVVILNRRYNVCDLISRR